MGLTPECDPIETIIISDAEGIQQLPDVSFGNGNYLVVWYESNIDNEYIVLTARVTPQWEVLDPGIIVDPNSISQISAAVASDGERFLVVWRDLDRPAVGIDCRFVGSDGLPQGAVISITSSEYSQNPRIVFGDTYYLVVWQENSASQHDIRGQFISPGGSLIGDPIVISSGSEPRMTPSLCWDGNQYLIVWSQEQIWGQFVSNSGKLIGSNFRISSSSNTQMMPWAAYGDGRYLSVWSEFGNDFDLYGNVDAQVGIEELPVIPPKTNIYPASTIFTHSVDIVGARGKNVTIFDLTGRKVGQTTEGKWNAGSVPSGVYFMSIEDYRLWYKIVKIR